MVVFSRKQGNPQRLKSKHEDRIQGKSALADLNQGSSLGDKVDLVLMTT